MKNTDDRAVKRIFVKVFGFSEAEMLALRSVFQASESGPVTYKLWSAESTDQARVLLIDGESWEASLELANPGHDTLKLVWVGSRAPATAWRVFMRPFRWAAVIDALDHFYDRLPEPPSHFDAEGKASAEPDFNFDLDAESAEAPTEPMPDQDDNSDIATEPQALVFDDPDDSAGTADDRMRILVVDADRFTHFYWRAKLSAAGLLLIDEASNGAAALELHRFHTYTLVILDMDLTDQNSWLLFKSLAAATPLIAHLILTGTSLTFLDRIRARLSGARGALRKPLHPGKVKRLLESLKIRQIP